jgi:hypothetical protein
MQKQPRVFVRQKHRLLIKTYVKILVYKFVFHPGLKENHLSEYAGEKEKVFPPLKQRSPQNFLFQQASFP